jgi:hypothetical protein
MANKTVASRIRANKLWCSDYSKGIDESIGTVSDNRKMINVYGENFDNA